MPAPRNKSGAGSSGHDKTGTEAKMKDARQRRA